MSGGSAQTFPHTSCAAPFPPTVMTSRLVQRVPESCDFPLDRRLRVELRHPLRDAAVRARSRLGNGAARPAPRIRDTPTCWEIFGTGLGWGGGSEEENSAPHLGRELVHVCGSLQPCAQSVRTVSSASFSRSENFCTEASSEDRKLQHRSLSFFLRSSCSSANAPVLLSLQVRRISASLGHVVPSPGSASRGAEVIIRRVRFSVSPDDEVIEQRSYLGWISAWVENPDPPTSTQLQNDSLTKQCLV